jgi:uncharacterized protein (TIGR02444 family)
MQTAPTVHPACSAQTQDGHADEAETLAAWAAGLRSRPDVAAACRRLQQRHALDVHLLLACCWAGRRGVRLPADLLAALARLTAPWQTQVTAPLAAVAAWLDARPGPDAAGLGELRARLDDAERAAEAQVLALLAARLLAGSAGPGTPADAIANLRLYFRHLNREPGVADAADLAPLLAAAFAPRLHPLDAVWQIQAFDDRPTEWA